MNKSLEYTSTSQQLLGALLRQTIAGASGTGGLLERVSKAMNSLAGRREQALPCRLFIDGKAEKPTDLQARRPAQPGPAASEAPAKAPDTARLSAGETLLPALKIINAGAAPETDKPAFTNTAISHTGQAEQAVTENSRASIITPAWAAGEPLKKTNTSDRLSGSDAAILSVNTGATNIFALQKTEGHNVAGAPVASVGSAGAVPGANTAPARHYNYNVPATGGSARFDTTVFAQSHEPEGSATTSSHYLFPLSTEKQAAPKTAAPAHWGDSTTTEPLSGIRQQHEQVAGNTVTTKNYTVNVESLIGTCNNTFTSGQGVAEADDFMSQLKEALQTILNDTNYSF